MKKSKEKQSLLFSTLIYNIQKHSTSTETKVNLFCNFFIDGFLF